MPPKTITLSDGMSHAISKGDFLRVRAWLVQGAGAVVEIQAEGATSVNRPEPSQVYLTDVTNRIALTVRPVGGGEFPPDHSVSLMVEQPTASEHIRLQFPEVRVDGTTQRVLGEIVPDPNTNTVTVVAFGSNVAADLPREAMTMVSALRSEGAANATIARLSVVVDASAAMVPTVTQDQLNLVDNVVLGIADHYDIEVSGTDPGWEADCLQHAATVVSAPLLEPTAEAGIIVTHAPRPAMAQLSVPTVVCVVGKQAAAQAALYQNNYGQQYPLAMVVFDDTTTQALADGEHSKLHDAAEIIAGVLGEKR